MDKSIKVICIADLQTHSDKRRASFRPVVEEEKEEEGEDQTTNVKSIQIIYGVEPKGKSEFELEKDYFIEIS